MLTVDDGDEGAACITLAAPGRPTLIYFDRYQFLSKDRLHIHPFVKSPNFSMATLDAILDHSNIDLSHGLGLNLDSREECFELPGSMHVCGSRPDFPLRYLTLCSYI